MLVDITAHGLSVAADVADLFIAATALALSWRAIKISRETDAHQRRHDRLSVRPLPFLALNDFENDVSVILRNNGTGPLLIEQLLVAKGAEQKSTILDWMPDLPPGIFWRMYVENVDGRSIPVGGEIILIQLEGDLEDPVFIDSRDQCRTALMHLCVRVMYTDVHGSKLNPYEREMSWFGRHLRNA